MSDTTTEAVEVEGAVEAAVPAVEAPTDPAEGDGQADTPLSRQAAKWRTRTRELEAELATATEQIAQLRRQRAEDLAAVHGLKPEALWATTQLDDLLGDDGTVDAGRIKTAVQSAVDTLNVRLRPTHGLHIPEGYPAPPQPDGRAKWDSKFRP